MRHADSFFVPVPGHITREAARPLRRYGARVRAASLPPSYTITRGTTPQGLCTEPPAPMSPALLKIKNRASPAMLRVWEEILCSCSPAFGRPALHETFSPVVVIG